MNEFITVLTAVLPILCVAAAGLGMRKLNWLTEEADASLIKMTINVLTPCLVFDAVMHNQAVRQAGNLLMAPTVGFVTTAFGIVISLIAARWFGITQEQERRTFALCTGAYNYGYVPLPLALTLFDRETAGVLLVHNVGVEVAIWTVGLFVLRGGIQEKLGWKKLLSPPIMAIVVTLALNFAGADRVIPQFVMATATMLGQCAIPIGLILIGATMADHMGDFDTRSGGRVMASACVLRMGILPIFFLLLAWGLSGPVELKRVILLQAAMPAAVFPIVMAKHYGGDARTALRVVIATSLVGFATIPLWIRLGQKILFPVLPIE